jgi:hypothetical protein
MADSTVGKAGYALVMGEADAMRRAKAPIRGCRDEESIV